MGRALAAEAIRAGFDVTILSGPVSIMYPAEAHVVPVVSTEEMYNAALELYPRMTGAIGAAAPCDYRPRNYSASKLTKDRLTRGKEGGTFSLELEETPDIIAALGKIKRPDQWLIPFALETDASRERALAKLRRKNGDLVLVNRPDAIGAESSQLEILTPEGEVLALLSGTKETIASALFRVIAERFAR